MRAHRAGGFASVIASLRSPNGRIRASGPNGSSLITRIEAAALWRVERVFASSGARPDDWFRFAAEPDDGERKTVSTPGMSLSSAIDFVNGF
jgi:hypothetical protein